eukprot:TRINITY_DN13590_c0_g1_i1.p1 TRINITY_DN13590_c0_g1~~TRINITY_DN13590_c0_g1_i1.p1  ORF type:complete len:922 (-),score=326.80 TRINITY_DN13590_c0_g1_i1:104-2500(-)
MEECPIDNLLSECADIMDAAPVEEVAVVVETEAPAEVVALPEPIVVQVSEPVEVVEQEIEIQEVEKCVEIAPQKDSIRTLVAQEILSTERTYVDGLRKCISLYMTPLTGKIEDSELHTLFGNLPNIMRLNEALLGQLEIRIQEWSETATLGDIFKEVAPFLSMYADYCSSFEAAAQLVVKFKQSNSLFMSLVEKNIPLCGGLDINDFLIMPVQRVPRYRLLLENLLKQTPEEHPDYAGLKDALTAVSDKAAEINQKMALQAQQKKMMELSMRFENPPIAEGLVQPYRHLVSEFIVEWIPSFENAEGKNIYMFVFNDLMVLAPVPNKADDMLISMGAYPLWGLFLKKLDDSWVLAKRDVPPFQLVHATATYNIVMSNVDEKEKFKKDLETNREKLLSAQPQLKTKRLAIKLEMNAIKQEWTAVEPAPTFASRISKQSLEREAAEFTQKALEELLRENKQTLENMTPISKTPKKSRLFALKETVVNALSPLVTPGGRRQSLFGFGSPSNRYASMPKLDSGALFAAAAEAVTSDAPLSAGSKPSIPVADVSAADLIRQQIDELNKKTVEMSKKDKKKDRKRKREEEAEAEKFDKAEKKRLKSQKKAQKEADAAEALAAAENEKKHKKKEKKHKKEAEEPPQTPRLATLIAEEAAKVASKKDKKQKKHEEAEAVPLPEADPVMAAPEKKRRKKKETTTEMPPAPIVEEAAAAPVDEPEKKRKKEKKHKNATDKENASDNIVEEVAPTPRASKKRKAATEAPALEEAVEEVTKVKKTKRSKTHETAVASEPHHMKGRALKAAN